MSTVSIPLTDDMVNGIQMLVKQGVAPNMSEVVRQAVRIYLEDQAVKVVLRAKGEPSLKGDLDDLATKL
ncbi:MAG: ribbon-helix-helix domain-containing protein [Patescibacteria group bacterium]